MEASTAMQRLAILSVHTSPIATPGGKKVGGMNTYVREIAQDFGRRGIQVDIFTRRNSPDDPAIDTSLGDNVRVIYVKAGAIAPLSTVDIYPHLQQFTAGVIAHTIRHSIAYDMIFSHYWLSGWVAQKLKEAWGIPFVQMFHTLGHMKNRIPSVKTPVPSIRIQTESKVIAWADMIIANTPAEQAQLLWLYNADRRKITVCPPGVNTSRFHPTSRQDAREAVDLHDNEQMLLFVGRIEPLKAVDSILDALHLLKQQQPDLLQSVRFTIVGGDPKDTTDLDMVALHHQVQALNLTDVVRFEGAKDQNTLVNYYAAAAALIVPSEYESFGMVALEAMATGTPVIASEVGGLAYLVQNGETGYLVPSRSPEDLAGAIHQMLTTPDEREVMGQNAAELAQNYQWAEIAERLLVTFGMARQPKTRNQRAG